MQHFVFKLGEKAYKKPRFQSLRQWAKYQLIIEKLDTPLGYLIMGVLAAILAYFVATAKISSAVLILVNVALIPCLFGAMFNLRFGIYLLLVGSFFLMTIKRIVTEVPLGIYMDATVAMMLLGILVEQTRRRKWTALPNAVSWMVLLWFGYNLLEYFNPIAPNKLGWIYTIRATSGLMLVFFVGLYAWDELKFIRRFLYVWIVLATFGALYGLIQEWTGLRAFEQSWLMENREMFTQFYTWDRFRVFSFFADPSVFGIMMAYSSLMSLGLILSPVGKRLEKVLLGLSVLIMILAMIYSSTRTAYVILPAGFFFFALLSPNKAVLYSAGGLVLILGTLLFIPTENTHLSNFQIAFQPSESASYQTQVENQAYIQPYVRRHAMGAGLGTTGAWGARFAPYTMLSQFPAASGYVRIAVEMGWMGLLIYCSLLFTILFVGVRNYFRCRNKEIRTYYRVFLTLILVLVLANYPQQALIQIPTSILFYLAMAAIVRLKDFDTEVQT